jgi:hypothetical protein
MERDGISRVYFNYTKRQPNGEPYGAHLAIYFPMRFRTPEHLHSPNAQDVVDSVDATLTTDRNSSWSRDHLLRIVGAETLSITDGEMRDGGYEGVIQAVERSLGKTGVTVIEDEGLAGIVPITEIDMSQDQRRYWSAIGYHVTVPELTETFEA